MNTMIEEGTQFWLYPASWKCHWRANRFPGGIDGAFLCADKKITSYRYGTIETDKNRNVGEWWMETEIKTVTQSWQRN